MSDYTICCTHEQTLKALELGAPIEVYNHFDSDDIREANIFYRDKFIELPDGRLIERITAEQMLGWMEEEQGLHVDVIFEYYCGEECYYYAFNYDKVISDELFMPRKDATLAAIDAALDYLKENKK